MLSANMYNVHLLKTHTLSDGIFCKIENKSSSEQFQICAFLIEVFLHKNGAATKNWVAYVGVIFPLYDLYSGRTLHFSVFSELQITKKFTETSSYLCAPSQPAISRKQDRLTTITLSITRGCKPGAMVSARRPPGRPLSTRASRAWRQLNLTREC